MISYSKPMYITLFILCALSILVYAILTLPVFGRLPQGARLERIRRLPNAEGDELQNQSLTPMVPEGGYLAIFKAMLKGNPDSRPATVLPHASPHLDSVSGAKVTWFGHSSYLLQLDTLKVLVDPVFSRTPSPFSFIGKKQYAGTDFIKAEDFPAIDVLLITHDHYDHMDYQSILKLKDSVKHFLTSAGAGSHLSRWGIPAEKITELAWEEQAVLSGLKFTAKPARHFTGRLFKRNRTLWSSFILETPEHKLYLGGDSGYDSHFKLIGEEHGPFDLAILECGQYNELWPLIHMFPEQTVMAAKDLKAKVLLPVHWGKFTLALHDWNDSIIRVSKSAEESAQQITTPLMGETFVLGGAYPDKKWWLNAENGKQ
ncbi:L-ascorbate metabolism protein UlaG (beta-lactamase superfamily) [Pedobacter cryoconitis]|uniref:L-ascorbate metabolism protein UlaG (Beta-lactamase superfamily) n=2 Tax=Pedobacter cryoconitis TaxID=188932 RepID=A0A327T6Q2_9SPHI|nr:L-ascorbate metabolism protein UlaG (beta-lactamase superfamily) [Pedobacter cryoconitis]